MLFLINLRQLMLVRKPFFFLKKFLQKCEKKLKKNWLIAKCFVILQAATRDRFNFYLTLLYDFPKLKSSFFCDFTLGCFMKILVSAVPVKFQGVFAWLRFL